MANLIITNRCCANCDFCFAAESRTRLLQDGHTDMSEAEFRSCLDRVLASGIRELRLLGGEPTPHPKFADFVRLGIEAGCAITVFSNGVIPAPALDALTALDPEICTVVINWTAAIRSEDKSFRHHTLKSLGPRAQMGLTVTSPDFSSSVRGAITMIKAFDLRKAVRVGLAHPTWNGANRSIHPKRYPVIGRKLLEESFQTARYGVAMEADCGFVRCMFGDQYDQLVENGFRYISHCSPVLDLCTGGTILPCFALSDLLPADAGSFPDLNAAYKWFEDRLKPLHTFGIYPECTDCPFFETEICCGGCLAARLYRLQPLEEERK